MVDGSLMNNLNILYEDNHIIVVVKPYNVLSQGDSTGDTSIMDMVKEYNCSLVSINLHTGRHHQIRVQFSSRGHYLLGDQRYGKLDNKQISLFSYYLSFTHPVTKEVLEFRRMPDKKDYWTIFTL